MATTMLNVYDMNRRKSAILQNASGITETRELNKIYTLDFIIPATDEKVKYIQPFHYVRWGDYGELYRIINTELDDSDTPTLKVQCEHVIATLVDDLMFGAVQYGGGTIKTSDVITYLLNQQKTQNWVLDQCDFDRRFEYLWEQENVLNALYSVPREFSKAYKWTFDTVSYPWKLSLKAIDETIHPEYYIRAKRNLLNSGTAQDFTGICTRIYPLGYGEGVNQLGIKEINNGLPYLQSPDSVIAQYGIKEKVLVDRRFENAESLKEYAQTMLDALQTPSMSRSFDVVDLYPITNQDIDNADVGKICKMTGDDTIAYVTKTVRVWDEPGNLFIDLSTKATDVASNIADLADRVRIESVYAQGATQLYQHSKDANATSSKGMIMSLYFPTEMRQINKVMMRLKLGKFRSYSQTADYGGAINKDTGKAGEINKATSRNGAIDQETGKNGEIDQTTGKDGAIDQETGKDGAIDQETGKNGSIDQETGKDGDIDQETGKDGDINQETGKDGDINQETGKDGDINQETEYGGKVDTSTGEGGGDSGETSVASGGGGISLGDISVKVSIDKTEDAVWDRTPYTQNTDLNIKVGNQGDHTHTVVINDGSTRSTTVPATTQSSSHIHYFGWENGGRNGLGYGYTNNGEGKHTHDAWVDNGDDATGHHHDIPRWLLKHYHTASGSGTVTVNNSEAGQSGFSHSHNFKIKSHTHSINIDGHTHTIKVDGHTHSINVGGHTHTIKVDGHTHSIKVNGHTHSISVGDHTHSIYVDGHTHPIKVDGHTHSIYVDGHTHSISVDAHQHTITVDAHKHDITPGIFEFGNPTAFSIYLGNTLKATINTTSYNGDITAWLLNEYNQIPRNTWIDIEIRPNDLAYVQSSVFVQGFVQSRGGGNY